ncbi:Sec63 Brl domain-containing protein [Syncephalis plumigaleata]|nr:Sec63 Brl domain-containing protein [Syncephalis plumigaleata]
MALVDILGLDNFYLLTSLVTHRMDIVRNTNLKECRDSLPKVEKPAIALDGERLRKVREQQLRDAASRPLASSNSQKVFSEPEYPHVFHTGSMRKPMPAFGITYVLPEGTVRQDTMDYEEIALPASTKAAQLPGEELISIASMDRLCRGCFPGYTTLNRVQSIVYPIAYTTNENMLICAPTGAGKTDVAMLSILRTLSLYCTPSPSESANELHIDKDAFKIVYVAPMKALAAEVVAKLGRRLQWLRVSVRELTGDMQLTKTEIMNTQIIVTTPEKWDVVTRKSTGDTELCQKVRLLIFDEVHLLQDDRGPVIETLIARTLRQVETSQSMIRIVGLSATLPNYLDVASFLRVNPYQGLFFFDSGFRPIPLEQHFIGVKGKAKTIQANTRMDNICYEKCAELVREGHQVMIFVHARKMTVKTAQSIRKLAQENDELGIFSSIDHPQWHLSKRDMARSRNQDLKELFEYGFGVHHAGMLRSDRNLVERLFSQGVMKVLCCTSTLAWGVNLPAYAVIIKGTEVYDAQKGGFTDLSILDVLQIFGRAGRPQFESQGVGYIMTSHERLSHYISLMLQQHPIESQFVKNIVDHLNAEICLGTVTTIDEAVTWLSYTYLYIRMKKNPLVYGLTHAEVAEDPLLGKRRRDLIVDAARTLHRNQMIIYDENTGYLSAKDLGRISAGFYIKCNTVELINERLRPRMTEADVLSLISASKEFDSIKSREEEAKDLKQLQEKGGVCTIKDTADQTSGKVNILLQAAISRVAVTDSALVSDTAYVLQNATRIIRALFEIARNRSWGPVAAVLLSLSKSLEKRMWPFEHPLGQLGLPWDIINKLESHSHAPAIESMRDMDSKELGQLVRNVRFGPTLARAVEQFPLIQLEATIAPISRSVLRMQLKVTPDFTWNDRIHGTVEPWWIWVEDSVNTEVYHAEQLLITRKNARETQLLGFVLPIPDPLPTQIFVRCVSDRWIGAETVLPVSFKHLILPEMYPQHTDLLDLQPLPVSALQDELLEEICRVRFSHFNPVQTQIFHTLYHSSTNALIGAPTGSGKTVAAELAMWWAFREFPRSKVVYIAPLKALVRERVVDWRKRLTGIMGRKLVELTGDVTPDIASIKAADIIITTPEKWDGISRGWKHRDYVRAVSLVIIDEIHLLGADRGPILEVIVSRMNYIGSQTGRAIRIVGLSTALANARDLADWLGIDKSGLFNFRHSVRPVPLEIYIDGFPGRHYCPRMALMNKPTFTAIKTHSPTQPVIVFVSSRRQTRLTAKDLMAYCAMEDNPRQFLHMPEEELQMLLGTQVEDANLRLSLGFGIGLHHAGLREEDRKLSEELFVNGKIQILIATSTLAWGVNFPAHLVVIKGTEFYDAKQKGYVDFPITDVLQMMGRAGRPQFDNSGIARIFVQDSKKSFYKKFLHEPFPVESSLHLHLTDHLNAEIVQGTLKTKQDIMDYLSWTYLYRRLSLNPTYYGLEDPSPTGVNQYLSRLIDTSLDELKKSGCVDVETDEETIVSAGVKHSDHMLQPTELGRIASFYYLQHTTMRIFKQRLVSDSIDEEELLRILCDAAEYDELPVRHNEDITNRDMAEHLPLRVITHDFDSPHTKAFLLLQAHLLHRALPVADYATDTISVLDQSVRILQALIDVAAELGYLNVGLRAMHLLQCIKQARGWDDSTLRCLPPLDDQSIVEQLNQHSIGSLAELLELPTSKLDKLLTSIQQQNLIEPVQRSLTALPIMSVELSMPDSVCVNSLIQIRVTLERLFYPQQRQHRGKSPNNVTSVSEHKQKYDGRAYTPHFPKVQYESWWLLLGDIEQDDVMALKRVNFQQERFEGRPPTGTRQSSTLCLQAPETPGNYEFTLFIISDGYLGLDQQIPVTLTILAE